MKALGISAKMERATLPPYFATDDTFDYDMTMLDGALIRPMILQEASSLS